MIIRFFKITKLPQVITASIVSLTIMLVLKNGHTSFNDFISLASLISVFLLSLFIISKNSILKNNQFTTLGLILFSGAYFKMPTDINIDISYILLLLSIRRIYSLKSNKNISKKLFDVGFWLAISCFFNPYNIFFLITVVLGIYFFYKINLKIILKSICGFLAATLLLLFYTSYTSLQTLNGDFIINYLDLSIIALSADKASMNNDYFHWSFAVSSSILFIFYSFKYFGKNLSERIKNLFLLIFFLNSLILVLLINEYSIFLFFPFLVTLIKIISELKMNLFIEMTILTIILINSYPF